MFIVITNASYKALYISLCNYKSNSYAWIFDGKLNDTFFLKSVTSYWNSMFHGSSSRSWATMKMPHGKYFNERIRQVICKISCVAKQVIMKFWLSGTITIGSLQVLYSNLIDRMCGKAAVSYKQWIHSMSLIELYIYTHSTNIIALVQLNAALHIGINKAIHEPAAYQCSWPIYTNSYSLMFHYS